jgi:hypothetical protein
MEVRMSNLKLHDVKISGSVAILILLITAS